MGNAKSEFRDKFRVSVNSYFDTGTYGKESLQESLFQFFQIFEDNLENFWNEPKSDQKIFWI